MARPVAQRYSRRRRLAGGSVCDGCGAVVANRLQHDRWHFYGGDLPPEPQPVRPSPGRPERRPRRA